MQKSRSNGEDHELTEPIYEQRRRALIFLLAVPLLFLAFASLLYLLWLVSIKWIAATDTVEKMLYLIGGFLLILVEILFGYLTRRLTRWATDIKGARNVKPDKS